MGGLRLDSRQALALGGDSGPAVRSDDPEQSLLLRVVRHELPDMKMPMGQPQLAPEQIDILRRWVIEGAQWPSLEPGTAAKITSASEWWSLAPLRQLPSAHRHSRQLDR